MRIAPAPYFDEASGIYFPGSIGNLHRRTVVQLEDRTPGLGLALSYRDAGAKLDIFVYDLGAQIIPVGISSITERSFEEALDQIERAADRKLYSNLNIQHQGILELAGQRFLAARMEYGESMLQKSASLYVSGVNGQILKIRISSAAESDFDTNSALRQIERAIAQSHARGFGGISANQLGELETTLSQVDLSDGLQPNEALAIAQRTLIEAGLHNRFDPSAATLEEVTGTIAFRRYSKLSTQEATLQIEVDQSGQTRIVSNPTEPRG